MSDVMLLGVLRMPMPDNPADMGGLEWAQVKDRMRQAADEIEKERAAVDGHIRLIEVLEDEVARLRAELHATVCNHDAAIEGWRKRVETVEAELAAERKKVAKLREALVKARHAILHDVDFRALLAAIDAVLKETSDG